jgi:hypothetical protein
MPWGSYQRAKELQNQQPARKAMQCQFVLLEPAPAFVGLHKVVKTLDNSAMPLANGSAM